MRLRLRLGLGTAAAVLAVAGCAIERHELPESAGIAEDVSEEPDALRGPRSVIYHVADLTAARDWYAQVLGYVPYFDEPYYVGFDVDGYELGLNPDTAQVKPGAGGTVAYWGVSNADSAFARVMALGAEEVEPVVDVGNGIRHAIVRDPFGNLLGLMENPNFTPR